MISKQFTKIFTKTELISKCRHQNKYTLSKYDTKDRRQLYCKKPLYCNFPLHSCDYLKKNSIKTNVATDEDSGRNET